MSLYAALTGMSGPLSEGWAGPIVLLLAVCLLAIVLRAWSRERRHGAQAWLVKGVPIGITAGVLVGVGFGVAIDARWSQIDLDLGRQACRDALGRSAEPERIESCAPVGAQCNRAEWEREEREHLGGRVVIDPATSPQASCVRARLGVPEQPIAPRR
jgi:hypothetical protein